MSKPSADLKSQNAKWLVLYAALQISVFLALTMGVFALDGKWDQYFRALGIKGGMTATVIPLFVIVANGLARADLKAVLVFWRWRNPLPGSRVFSDLLDFDSRIDRERLRSRLGVFPRKPEKQNALWYSVYQNHKDDPAVVQSHRTYLLLRDMAWLSVLFAAALVPTVVQLGLSFWWIYGMLQLVAYVACAFSARNEGVRFTLNVLAAECGVRARA